MWEERLRGSQVQKEGNAPEAWRGARRKTDLVDSLLELRETVAHFDGIGVWKYATNAGEIRSCEQTSRSTG